MKSAIFLTSLSLALIVFCFGGCKKDKFCIATAKGRIIGYDPCWYFVNTGKVTGSGFVIEIDHGSSKDTTVTYGLPEGKFVFKQSYIDGSYSSYLFRPEVQDLFKIKFNYRLAKENEKTAIPCLGIINIADFLAAVKGKEIFISCISNQ
jgi:hypothetical protein